MAIRVFINYRREDEPDFVYRVQDSFELRFGEENVFIDQKIPETAQWRQVILDEAAKCDVMIVMIGSKWKELLDKRSADGDEDFVVREIELAIEQKKLVVPICIKGAVLPSIKKLPETIRPVFDRQVGHLNSDTSFKSQVQNIIKQIESILSTAVLTPTSSLTEVSLEYAQTQKSALMDLILFILSELPSHSFTRVEIAEKLGRPKSRLNKRDIELLSKLEKAGRIEILVNSNRSTGQPKFHYRYLE